MIKIYSLLVFVMFLWGLSFSSAKVLTQTLHPLELGFLRFFVSSFYFIFFLILEGKEELKKISKQDLIMFVLLGFSGILSYNVLFFIGLEKVEAGKASVIIASNPLFSLLIASVFLGEGINAQKILGGIIGFLGLIYVLTEFNLNFKIDKGEIYMLLAAFSWVIYTLLGKKVLNKFSAMFSTSISVLLGTIFLFPIYINFQTKNLFEINFNEWTQLVFLGLGCTVFGFSYFYKAIQKVGVSKASSFINLVPIFGILGGIMFLQEALELKLIFGLIAVITGIFLVNNQN